VVAAGRPPRDVSVAGRPPRVAVDLRALVPAPTGIGIYTRSLLLALARRGGFDLVGLAHRPPHHEAELRAAGVEVAVRTAPLGVLWQQLVLPRELRRVGAKLLWSPITTLPLACPVPAVVTVHDLSALLFPETHRLKVRWSVVPFLRPTLERARVVVADSRATAGDLARHFPECAPRLRVVHPGIDADFRPASAEEVAATRAELAAPRGYVLFAGTLEPRKNLPGLLDAWERLRARGLVDEVPLLLAGPYGWRSRKLLRRIERLAPAGVRYLGRLERAALVATVQAARAFVYPSLHEGFGLPPAEALACGVPTAVSDLSSLPEVVGDAGLRFDPYDPDTIADAIAQLLALAPDASDEWRERALRQAARFTWESAAEGLAASFTAALGGNRAEP
jgi:glycosyltransferase involved in cell wall biosynthesis